MPPWHPPPLINHPKNAKCIKILFRFETAKYYHDKRLRNISMPIVQFQPKSIINQHFNVRPEWRYTCWAISWPLITSKTFALSYSDHRLQRCVFDCLWQNGTKKICVWCVIEVSTLILRVHAYNELFEQEFAKINTFNMIVGKCVNICKMMICF